MRSRAAQMLRTASALLAKASREAAKTSAEYAELCFPGVSETFAGALPRRVKNVRKKALRREDPLAWKKYVQKGWPRGYEFGTRRMTRKLRPGDWDSNAEGFAW